MWSRLDTERKHSSLAAGDQLLPGRRTSDGGSKTYPQPPLLRAPSTTRKRQSEGKRTSEREREQGRNGGTGEVGVENLMK